DPGSGVSGIRVLDPPARVLRDDDPAKGRREPPVLCPAFRPPTVAASGSPGDRIGSDSARPALVSGVRGPPDPYSTRVPSFSPCEFSASVPGRIQAVSPSGLRGVDVVAHH